MDKTILRKKFAEEWQKHYKVETLIEKGYSRKQCKSCKTHFWTLDSGREICADSKCVGYGFIGKPTKRLGYTETWAEIAKYFKKQGHTEIKRYPTVCRWRDDLYFTNASIIDFQPYVVSGEIEPPANPLIVPQTSLRFGDITNVGVTGSHYTCFVMFGQHAFNSKKTGNFYWKDEALHHDFTYVTKVLGAKKEEVIFKEDVWAGGGTFGPCIEYFCNGLELGNCVFMQFKELGGGKFEELSTRVIDMGAGLERLAWFTNGNPTSYEITFGQVAEKMKKAAGIDIDKKLLLEFAKLSGSLNVDEASNIGEQKKKIAKQLGFDEKELFSKMRRLQAVYAIADHTKTILYTATDGMLPSNAGGGYNLRLLLRRVFGFNEEFGLNLDFEEILAGHAKQLKGFDDTVGEGVSTAIDVIAEERKKFSELREFSQKKVSALVERKKSEGKSIDEKELVRLYESDGIPLELVEEIAKKHGFEFSAPDDFYGSVARKNEKEDEAKQKALNVSGFKKTKMLYYEDQNLRNFNATVLGTIENYLILDKTAFYAEGGGQAGDTGAIDGVPVLDTQKIEGVVLHEVKDASKFRKGKKVFGEIDWKRRVQLKAHHTGAHLLNAASKELFGRHIWQAGAHKGEDKAHLDITHFRKISREELNQLELLVNAFIQQNVPVQVSFMPRNKAEEKFGFSLYQGGYVPGKELRVVQVEGIDVEACGGTHVSRTGEIGAFKIVKREGVQDGIERIVYVAGEAAIRHSHQQEKLLEESAQNLNVPVPDLPKATQRFFSEWKEQKKEISQINERLSELVVKKLLQTHGGRIGHFFDNMNSELLFKLALQIASERKDAIVLLGSPEGIAIVAGRDSSANAQAELQKILAESGGKGGGNAKIARGSTQNSQKLKHLLSN